MVWETIDAFESPDEYGKFVRFMERQIEAGEAKEVEADPDYGKGEIYGGRWFKEKETGVVWRLVEPDFPFKGLFEPVDLSGS